MYGNITTADGAVILEDTQPPQFLEELKPMRVLDGEEVILKCVVTGKPMPDILWFHNDRCINKNEDFVVKYNRDTGVTEVIIVECFPEDTGVFKCVATNSAGDAITSSQLTVAVPSEGVASELSELDDGPPRGYRASPEVAKLKTHEVIRVVLPSLRQNQRNQQWWWRLKQKVCLQNRWTLL